MKKRPTLETHSIPCCGECFFCHPSPNDKAVIGCFVSPPEYAYGEEEVAVFLQFSETSVRRPQCEKFKRKGES